MRAFGVRVDERDVIDVVQRSGRLDHMEWGSQSELCSCSLPSQIHTRPRHFSTFRYTPQYRRQRRYFLDPIAAQIVDEARRPRKCDRVAALLKMNSARRARQACEPCRRKKARCPGERPACSYCHRLGQRCFYGDSSPAVSSAQRVTKPMVSIPFSGAGQAC